jgi:Flp pilus assembly protein TadD
MSVSRIVASPHRPLNFRRSWLAWLPWLAALLAGSPAVSARAVCTGPPALEAKLRTHPTGALWAELGNWFGDHQQVACARDAFRSGLRLAPDSAQLNYLLGLSLYEAGSVQEAVSPLRRSIQLDSSVVRPHLVLATAFAHLGQPADAESEWRAALRLDPDSTMARHGLVEALMAQQNFAAVISLLNGAKLDEDLAVDLAIAMAQNGMLVDAVGVLERAMQASPDSVRLSNALVTIYAKVSRTLDAQRLAEQTYKAHPNDISVQIAYLRILITNGDWAPARPVGARLLVEEPHDFDVLYLNGVLERQASDFADARAHLEEAVTLQPSQQSAHANLGIALSRLHDPADAKVQLEKAIELGNTEPETRFELANVLRTLGDSDGARQQMLAYQQAVKDKDNTSLAVSKSAEAEQALSKNDVQRAIDLYREAFAATPKNALVGYRLATTLDRAGDLDGERTVLEQVVAIDPTIALAQNQLGYLDSQRGDYAAAEQHFALAVHSAPGFTQAWISLAATLGMESKYTEARDAVASALRLEPDNGQALQLSHDLSAAQAQHP